MDQKLVTQKDIQGLKSLLHWYNNAGVTCLCAERLCNHFEASPELKHSNKQTIATKNQDSSNKSPLPKAAQDAIIAVKNCHDISELKECIKQFDSIAIAETAAHNFLGKGNPQADILILSGMPNADDERSGTLLSGAAGALLLKMLASIGLSPDHNVFIASSIFWRPPGDRAPTRSEMTTCLPFLERLMYILKPKRILTLGRSGSQSLVQSEQSLNQIRQKGWQNYQTSTIEETSLTIPFMATYNSSDLLVTPKFKRNAWQDLLKFRSALEQDGLV